MTQVLTALSHLHDVVGLIHRDVKLANFRYRSRSPDSELVLLDFGLAGFINRPWDRTCCGTKMFMAPEVLSQSVQQKHMAAMDLWAAGVILFVLLTGDSPIQENEVNIFERPD